MSTSTDSNSRYEEAVNALFKYHQDQSPHVPELLEKSKRFFTRCGHKLEELKDLNAIHVAGTKGKGSVSAMCESILRKYGLKTGLLTSPHLIELRERIQINGKPITKDQYVAYFWECLNRLESTKANDGDMPSYYRFFTFMALHVFLCEKVDVAVIEVGKGGAFDTTNILIDPLACGITLMDMDHTDVLGDTLEKITWHKAGIAKPGSPMVIFPQKPGPQKVIFERAKEIGVSSLEVIPELEDYSPEKITIGLRGEHNKLNASLAAQLCKKWLVAKGMWDGQSQSQDVAAVDQWEKPLVGVHEKDNEVHIPFAAPFELPNNFLEGLKSCYWPGRCQIEKRSGITFYLDAAHTPLSIETCAKWFSKEADMEMKEIGSEAKVMKVLLFNCLGCRDPNALLPPLLDCDFECAVFAPSFSGGDGTTPLEQTNPTNDPVKQHERSQGDEKVWQRLCSEYIKPKNGLTSNPSLPQVISKQPLMTKSLPSIDYAIKWISDGRGSPMKSTSPEKLSEVDPTPDDLKSATHVQVLVTGSARLLGIAMYVLDLSVSQ